MDKQLLEMLFVDAVVAVGFGTFLWLMFFFVKCLADNEVKRDEKMKGCFNCIHNKVCVKWRKPALYGIKQDVGCATEFKAISHIVEVVYCGECRLVDTDECPMNGTPGRVSTSDFCSYGERKDNG